MLEISQIFFIIRICILAAQTDNKKQFIVKCKDGVKCSGEDVREYYLGEGCRMLKDFKHSSHVLCHTSINTDQFDIEELEENHHVELKRSRRHVKSPSYYDVQDSLIQDQYHRYEHIVTYLKVFINLISSKY